MKEDIEKPQSEGIDTDNHIDATQSSADKPDIIIDVRQYQTLLEILDNPRKALKAMGAIIVLTIAIFAALAFVIISIKSFYPYNEIKTNMFGATTIENEDVELTYWLFNTAEMWANSGIRVEKGDILTIRASGKSNTAIHHLIEQVENNQQLTHNWAGTEGHSRNSNRSKFRIMPERASDALIMQVIPEDVVIYDDHFYNNKFISPNYADDCSQDENYTSYNNYYFIGKERTDLRIVQDGILHFTVNDIVLTHNCVSSIQAYNNTLIKKKLNLSESEYNTFMRKVATLESLINDTNNIDEITEIVEDRNFANNCKNWIKYNKESVNVGKHPVALDSTLYKHLDVSHDNALPFYNEMHYYRDNNYYNAWFDDNVGSFLIVIEKQKNKN